MLSSSASIPRSSSLWILLVFKNPLLFISSMFTVARSGAVSDMYSGDAPPSLIMHKYGECATKEISCLWLELLFASPLCLSDCFCAALVYTEHSYTAHLSCCPEELIYSAIYWAELPCFVMTGFRGEKECGGKQNSALRLQNAKNKTYELSKMFPLLTPHPGERTRDSPPQCAITQFRASWSHNAASKNRNNVSERTAGLSWSSPPFLSCSKQLASSFWFHLVMLCAGLTYAGPAQRAEGSHFSSGSKSADELILMKELDAVGDALKGLLGVGGWGRWWTQGQGKQMLRWRWASWELYIWFKSLVFWHKQIAYCHYQ